jgi:ABC-type transport system involved in Fe-S cluster assembly fused permease/ATPase subunit
MRSAATRHTKRLHSHNLRRMESYPALGILRGLPFSTGERSNAASADVKPTVLTVDHHAFALDIRTEHAVGRTLRVTYVVPKHWALAADFTL